jgi:hypothetical protein
MSATQLLGHWRNTDPESKGIAEVRVEPDPAGIRVGLRVRTREGDREWPSAPCELYDCIEEDRAPGAAALGMVVLDGLEVELQLRVNKGILCVMTWTRFLDGSRHDYVVRELFARVDTHPLLGTWHNSDASTKGVTTLVFERGPALAVRAFAAAGPGGGARVISIKSSREPVRRDGVCSLTRNSTLNQGMSFLTSNAAVSPTRAIARTMRWTTWPRSFRTRKCIHR